MTEFSRILGGEGFVSSLGDASIAIRVLRLIGLLYIVIPLDSNPSVNSVSPFDAQHLDFEKRFLEPRSLKFIIYH